MKNNKLKPCPFCGSTEVAFLDGGVYDEMRFQIECQNCGRKTEKNVKINGGTKMKFRTKLCEIEATKWTGENVAEIMRFVKNESAIITNGVLIIKTLEGDMVASAGDYIIRGLRGEYYPCKPDVFQKKYEPCE